MAPPIAEVVAEAEATEITVECKKCGRTFKIPFFPFTVSRIKLLTRGAELAPYLQAILDEELGPQPELIPFEPPKHVPSCSKCSRPAALPKEGDTFKKRTYRGKFKTIGRPPNSGGAREHGAELDPDATYDVVDQTLSIAYRKSRYGKEIDYAIDQANHREWLHEPAQLEHAQKVLDGLSLREIANNWGIPRMTASRGQKEIRALADARKVLGYE